MFLTYKIEVWIKAELDNSLTKEEIIVRLSNGLNPCEVLTDEILDYESLIETEEFLSPEENDNQSTIALCDDNENILWTNI